MKYLITVIFLLISTVSIAQDKIDIIIVKKSERILYAVKDDKIIKKYDIAIGQNPEGHKLKEGEPATLPTPRPKFLQVFLHPQFRQV